MWKTKNVANINKMNFFNSINFNNNIISNFDLSI